MDLKYYEEKFHEAGLTIKSAAAEYTRKGDLSLLMYKKLSDVGVTADEVKKLAEYLEKNDVELTEEEKKRKQNERMNKVIRSTDTDSVYNEESTTGKSVAEIAEVQGRGKEDEETKEPEAPKEKKIIHTTCPLPMEVLKQYFEDKENTAFVVNYRGGKLDADALMIYLSNLNLDADFDEETYNDRDALKELVAAYMKTTTSLVDIEQLAREALAICCYHRNVIKPDHIFGLNTIDEDELDDLEECDDPFTHLRYFEKLGRAEDFIQENLEVVERWCTMLDSSGVYNLHCLGNPEFDDFIEQTFETINDPDYVGINYVNLYSLSWIGYYIGSIAPLGDPRSNPKFFTNQFNEYRFKGKNMNHYFNTEANILSVQTQVMAAGEHDALMEEWGEGVEVEFPDLSNIERPTTQVEEVAEISEEEK